MGKQQNTIVCVSNFFKGADFMIGLKNWATPFFDYLRKIA
jgi:hypothetical protein